MIVPQNLGLKAYAISKTLSRPKTFVSFILAMIWSWRAAASALHLLPQDLQRPERWCYCCHHFQ
jgi:hypothetical protein